VYTQRFFYAATDPEFERKAFIEIEKALAINPDQAEAHLARAQLIWNFRNGFPHERAIADLRRALSSNPNLAEAHVELGKVYYHIGLLDKAIAENSEALKLDPLAAIADRRRIAAMIDAQMWQALRTELDRNDPRWPLYTRVSVLHALGQPADALRALEDSGVKAGSDNELGKLTMGDASQLGHLYARLNRRADAERVLAVAKRLAVNPTGLSDIHHAEFAIGSTLALLGRRDEALVWLTKAANEGYPSYPRFSTEPDLSTLKGHPGFDALLERLRKDHERWRSTL
jgi:tetratricopeptide (TPR) repeat protein